MPKTKPNKSRQKSKTYTRDELPSTKKPRRVPLANPSQLLDQAVDPHSLYTQLYRSAFLRGIGPFIGPAGLVAMMLGNLKAIYASDAAQRAALIKLLQRQGYRTTSPRVQIKEKELRRNRMIPTFGSRLVSALFNPYMGSEWSMGSHVKSILNSPLERVKESHEKRAYVDPKLVSDALFVAGLTALGIGGLGALALPSLRREYYMRKLEERLGKRRKKRPTYVGTALRSWANQLIPIYSLYGAPVAPPKYNVNPLIDPKAWEDIPDSK